MCLVQHFKIIVRSVTSINTIFIGWAIALHTVLPFRDHRGREGPGSPSQLPTKSMQNKSVQYNILAFRIMKIYTLDFNFAFFGWSECINCFYI